MRNNLTLSLVAAFAVAFFSASAVAGSAANQKLFKKKCGICHKMDKNAGGPKLKGVIGRKAGSTDFAKYKALKGADFTWNEKNMDKWLADPKKFIGKKTSMPGKIKKKEERAAIIAYLKSTSN